MNNQINVDICSAALLICCFRQGFQAANAGRALPLMFQGAMGYGLQAPQQGITAGAVVLSVPAASWARCSGKYALQTARSKAPAFYERLQQIQQQAGSLQLANSACLSMALQFSLSDQSDWLHPYSSLLFEASTAAPETPLPLLMQPTQLQHLQASPLASSIQRTAAMYRQLHASLFAGTPASDSSEQLFLWAIATLLSRASSSASTPFTMLPYFDFLNHSTQPTCVQGYDSSSGSFTVTALVDHAPGQQLFISYDADSKKGLYQFVRTYGFADFDAYSSAAAAHTARDMLRINLPAAAGVAAATLQLPVNWGAGLSAMPALSAAVLTPEVMQWCRSSALAATRQLNSRRERAAYTLLASQVQAALAVYSTTVEEDVDVLEAIGNRQQSSSWEQLCVRIRVAEKLTLLDAAAQLQSSVK
jgi:Rubisco LSMT substrate-binding/SET domain